MLDRPTIMALVAWPLPDNELHIRHEMVTLEVAHDFRRLGWSVLVDPESEAELVRWEQIQRSLKSTRYSRW